MKDKSNDQMAVTMDKNQEITMKRSDIDNNINYRQKQFELNLDKTLAKKIEAAKRDVVVEYEFTNGGIVGTTDAATFEL